jgi:uncharacterized protein
MALVIANIEDWGLSVDLVDRPLYLDRIEPFVDAPVVKVLTGLRRSGKSRLLKLVAQRLRDRGP